MIERKLLFQLSKDVLSQKIDGESVLLDMKSEHYFGLNDIGGKVLELLKNGVTVERILDILLKQYDVKEEQLETDIKELLQQLLDAQLIIAIDG